MLFLTGVALNGFPLFNMEHLRVYGVLQRIALSYYGAVAVIRTFNKYYVMWLCAFILVIYCIMLIYSSPSIDLGVLSKQHNLIASIDRALFATEHLYQQGFDPEGLLSTLPAVVTVLFGYLAGDWLRLQSVCSATSMRLGGSGFLAILAGCLWSFWLPINKQLWTSSYVMVTAGAATVLLAVIFELVEVHDVQGWIRPLQVVSNHSLLLFVGSEMVGGIVAHVPFVQLAQRSYLKAMMAFISDAKLASFFYAVTITAVWLVVALLLDKRRKRIV